MPSPADEGRARRVSGLRREAAARVALHAVDDTSPATARADARLGRQAGIPLQSFDDATRPMAEARARSFQVQDALSRAPRLAPILADPRRYQRVSDDLAPLTDIVDAVHRQSRDMAATFMSEASGRREPRRIGGGGISPVGQAISALLSGTAAVGEALVGGGIEMGGSALQASGRLAVQTGVTALGTIGGAHVLAGSPSIRDLTDAAARPLSRASQEAARPIVRYGNTFATPTDSPLVNRLQTAARSAGGSAILLLASAATRNPLTGTVIAGVAESERAYEDAIASGLNEQEARSYADINGLIEGGMEYWSNRLFVGDIVGGSGFLRTLRNQVASEVPSELATTAGQELNRFASIERRQGVTVGEFVRDLPGELLDTFITTILATGMTTSISHPIATVVNRRVEQIQARTDARTVDRIMGASAQSRTRTESPHDFREIMDEAADGTPVENLYIPPENIRQLFQTPEDLAEDNFWSAYAEDIAEAEAIGGDVVIPLSEAATHLAGNPQWEALKDHARTSAGGMSRIEAEEANEAFADAIRQTGEELTAELEADRAAMEPVVKVYEAMRDKLMLAGFRADAASQLATQFSQRQAVRAQRLGRPLTGQEAGEVEVRQILPERLAQAITAAEVPDAGLRDVIAEMRRKRGVRSEQARFGPSLLDWIAKRGGIEDRGGDIAAMGAGPLRGSAKKGQRKLIRPSNDGQPSLLGADGQQNSNSPDELALRAWEAGYFTEFAERPSVNDLLNAISEGLSGRDRFVPADENQADMLRDAAQELSSLLDQRGLDADTASDAEIARTVSQYQSERMEGRSFGQGLFDDPEQPRRSMTTEQRAELDARQLQSMARRGGQASVKDQAGGLFSAERDQDSLFQTYGDGPRGRITFTSDGRSVIDLFEARDLSTLIHESGHLYLEELKTDAAIALQLDTVEGRQLFADFETVKAWFAREGHPIGEDGVIPTEAHEMWARGFERYAMEGKAPSSTLRRAFEAFRSWLLNIYKTADRLRAPITPEIRDVMARLLATDEEIAAAQEEQQIKALFKTAKEAGMTAAEFAAYNRSTEDARDEAHSALLQRTMATIRASRTKEYRTQEASVNAEIAAAVDNQPVFKTLRLLRTGKVTDEEARPVKLDRQFLIDSYGPDALDAMPKSVPPIFGSENTTHPDVIAGEVGFESGDEMIRMLMGHEQTRQELRAKGDKRSPRQVLIDEETAARMAERYGDPLRDGSIEEEARALIHNDRQGEVIAAEIRALGRKTGQRPTPYSIARQWAAERIATGVVVGVASGTALQQYQRAARRAAKLAEEAMLKGDANETFRQKQSQMLNNALISEGRKAKDRIDIAVRRLGKLAKRRTMKSVDQDYLDQVHGLLEQVDLGQRSQTAIDKRISFETWAAAQEAAGHDLTVPASFANTLGQTHWSRLSVEELIGLDDTVQQIIHLGRLKQTLLDGKERRDREEVIAEMEAVGGGLKQRPPSTLNDPDRNFLDKTRSKLRGADAAMVKIEQLCLWLDGNRQNGPFTRMIFRPMAEAQGREADMMRLYVEKMNVVLSGMPKEQLRDWGREVDTPELIVNVEGHPERGRPWRLYKDQIVMLAMNWGNEGNRQRIVDGYRWSEAQVEIVLARLMSAEDWAFVQATWDTIDELWPQVAEMERRVNGFAPDKVEAIPVETPFGTFRGGYFPAVYDPTWSSRAEANAEKNLLEANYVKANTRASSTQERIEGVKRPILLSMGVITRHLGEVIHDITHREALIEVNRIVSDERIQRVISNTMGPEYGKLLTPWLKHIANDAARNANSNSIVVNFFRGLNRNVTLVGLGYRLTSAIAQVAGMPNIIAKIGAVRMGEGWLRFMSNPLSAYREVTDKSAEMRDRFSTMDRDIVERAQQMAGRRGIRAIQGPGWFTKYAFHFILIMDAFLTTAGWIGAYRKAAAEGMSEEEAVAFADQTIRLSQGAGGAKDQAAITREHEAVKVFTRFFSYFSALYSQQRDVFHRLRRIESAKDAGTVLHRAFWVMIMPPIVDGLIREWMGGSGPGDDDEDGEISLEERGEWLASRVMFGNIASIPGIREVGGAVDSGFGYRISPVSMVGESLLQGFQNVERMLDRDEGTEPSDRWVKQTLTLYGLLFGKPTGQLSAAAQFSYDTATGEAEPETVGDYYTGLTRGRLEEVE